MTHACPGIPHTALHYATPLCTTLHYTTLHYITLCYTTRHSALLLPPRVVRVVPTGIIIQIGIIPIGIIPPGIIPPGIIPIGIIPPGIIPPGPGVPVVGNVPHAVVVAHGIIIAFVVGKPDQ
jgi:hypothetical protein